MYDFGIMNGQLYVDGALIKKHLYINKDHIVAMNELKQPCKDTYDATGMWVLPGLIDPHVHFELGSKLKSVDDFSSGSISAAYGGITTFIDFLDPIEKASDFRCALSNRYMLAKRSMIDYSFHATVKNPVGEVEGIVDEMKHYGINSVKLFTTYSDSGRRTYDSEITQLLNASKEEDILVMVHTEKDDLIDLDPTYEVKELPISRPKRAELEQALDLCRMVEATDGRLYMVHLSHGDTLKTLKEKYPELMGDKFIVESCPQYFYLDDSVYETDKGYLYTLAPPLREAASKERLIELVDDVQTIGTDHCPYLSKDKKGKQLVNTPMGIGGVEHSFDLMYSLIGLDAVEKMSIEPAKTFGLYPKKGSLDFGTDADIMIYDPNGKHTIGKDNSAADYSVYEGIEVKGRVISTICKGQFVIKDRALVIGSVGHFVKTRKDN